MESPENDGRDPRTALKESRELLLSLHKALLDSERTSYEIAHGPIGSSSAFLNLLINDPSFAWLQPITSLIVQIDETLAAKNPPAEPQSLAQLLTDTHALLSPSRELSDFWRRYSAVLQRDPGVALMHGQLEKQLTQR